MRKRPVIEALEPRILYSADLGPLAAPAVQGPTAAEQRLIDADLEFADQTAQAQQNVLQEVAFIDARTPDYEQLVDDIAAQSGRHIDVVLLDPGRDGLAQITEALAGREDVAAVHIIGHGADGVMQLGGTLVTAEALETNPGLVESWGQALTADADILLYGCDIAATAQGRLLVDTLARLTGADVSASDDATGHESLGGDWTLEYATGTIEAPVVVSAGAQAAWAHLLPSVVLTSYEPDPDDMTDLAYEISGGVTWSQSFTHTSGTGAYVVDQIDLVLYRNGSTSGGNIIVELRSGLGGSSSVLGSGSVARMSLGMSEGWSAVSLSAPVPLTDGATYFISIKGTGPGNVFVGVDDAGVPATYAGGTFFNSSNVAEPTRDMAFRIVSNAGPVVDLNAGDIGQDAFATFIEQTPANIAPVGTITDFDSPNLSSLTATITARPDGDAAESLSLTDAAALAASDAGLTVAYTPATGMLSVTGSATVATYQTILQGIQYNNTSDAPTTTTRSVVVVANDGTTDSSPRTSFISVTAVNDAPVIGVPGGQTTSEDTALVFSAGGGNAISITDDAGANPIQVSLSGTNGVISLSGVAGLSFSVGDGTADATMTFTGTLAAVNTALEGMSFLPALDFSGAASLSITVDDQGSTGTGGAASDTDSVAITVTAVNDAPVLTPVGPMFPGITEDQAANTGETVATLLVASVTDVDAGAVEGIAVTGLVSGNGAWEYSLDDGTTWIAVGAVSDTSALLLRDTDRLRFVPDGENADAGSVTYRAWDRTSGTQGTKVDASSAGGTTAFSTASDTASVTVTAVNDAPVLAGANNLTAISEDPAVNGGTLVSTLIAGQLIDVDAGALSGIAVTAVDNTSGTWEYSTDGGASWAAFGSPAVAAARLLAADANTYLRFVPDADFNGVVSNGITFRAWDQTSGSAGGTADTTGNGGDTAFSTATASATITVTAVNDAPVNTVPAAQTASENTDLVFSAGGGNAISISDVDAGMNAVRVTLSGTNGAVTLASLAGLAFTVGDGTADGTMTFSGTVSAINAALDGLSFMPAANFSGTASLSITTDDQGNTGAGGSLTDADSVTITVLPNVAPSVTASGGITAFVEGNNVASTPVIVDSGIAVSDPDSTALASATVSIVAGWQAAEDVLGFTGNPATMGNITGTYNAATGVLDLTSAGATATLGQWQAALRSVTYTNLSDTPDTAARTIGFVVTGEGGTSAVSTQTVSVTEVNDTPIITAGGGVLIYTTTGAAVPVDSGIAAADADNATLASATVSISSGFRAAEDALGFTGNPATTGNITGSYNAASGTLTLASAGATATLAQWEAALRSVTYTNTSAVPSGAIRTVSFVLSDGAASSAEATQSIALNVPPVVPAAPEPPPPPAVEPPPPIPAEPPPPPAAADPSPPPATSDEAPPPGGGLPGELLAALPLAGMDPATLATTSDPSQVVAPDTGVPGFRFASYGIVAPTTDLVRELFFEALQQVDVQSGEIFRLNDAPGQTRSADAEDLGSDLARLRESLQQQEEIQTHTVVTLTAGSLSMTIAYLLWLIRGGALAASVLSALPAWRLLDPLPILARTDDVEDEDDEEDDRAIASFSDAPVSPRPA